jgi:hypothetical protein
MKELNRDIKSNDERQTRRREEKRRNKEKLPRYY